MACSGSHCDAHGTGTTTCSNHRGTCSTNRAVTTDFTAGNTIKASIVNALRTAIRDEITRYNLHVDHSHTLRQGTAYTTTTNIDNSHISEMEQMVYDGNNRREREGYNYATWSDPTTYGITNYAGQAAGATITDNHWADLKGRYNTLRTDCICNSDCACNLVCNCHNDCGCNYSDVRLKENIKPLYRKHGLNVYSFNYIDDTTPHIGVMAQELLNTEYRDAVSQDKDGYYMVNYNLLPI